MLDIVKKDTPVYASIWAHAKYRTSVTEYDEYDVACHSV